MRPWDMPQMYFDSAIVWFGSANLAPFDRDELGDLATLADLDEADIQARLLDSEFWDEHRHVLRKAPDIEQSIRGTSEDADFQRLATCIKKLGDDPRLRDLGEDSTTILGIELRDLLRNYREAHPLP